jgi:hypothetical protein
VTPPLLIALLIACALGLALSAYRSDLSTEALWTALLSPEGRRRRRMVRALVAAQREAIAHAYLLSEAARLGGDEAEADRLFQLAVNYERSLAPEARRIESGLAACRRMLSALLR